MLTAAVICLAWSAACWFSGGFAQPFLNLPIFALDAAAPLSMACVLFIGGAVLRFMRPAPAERTPIDPERRFSGKDLLLLGGVIAVFVVLTGPALAVHAGIGNSDTGVYGIAAYHIAEGGARPLYYPGNIYNGSLGSCAAAALQALFGKSSLWIILVNWICLGGFVIGTYAVAWKIGGSRLAAVAGLLSAIPPIALFEQLASTYIPQVICLGVWALYLALARTGEAAPRQGRLLWSGVLLGIGLWVHPLTVYFIFAWLLLFLVRDPLFFLRARSWAAALGFICGATPMWLGLWYYRFGWFALISRPGSKSGGLPERFAGGLAELLRQLPALVGLPVVRTDAGMIAVVPGLTLIALLAFAFLLWRAHTRVERIRQADRRDGWLPVLLFVAVVVIFAALDESRADTPFYYIAPLALATTLLAAMGIDALWRTRRVVGVAALAAALACFGWSIPVAYGNFLSRTHALSAWEEFCSAHGIKGFYGDFWRSYWVNWASEERLIGSAAYHFQIEHYPPYYASVAAQAPSAYLFDSRQRSREREFVHFIDALRLPHEQLDSPMGTVYLLPMKLTPAAMIGYSPWDLSAGLAVGAVRVVGDTTATVGCLTEVRIDNTGPLPWFADGRNGYFTLEVRDSGGALLVRQPLLHDVPSVGSALERLVIPGDGSREIVLCFNDFPLARTPFAPPAAPARARALETAGLYAGKSTDPMDSAITFADGWGGVRGGRGGTIVHSGAAQSKLTFLLERPRGVECLIRLQAAGRTGWKVSNQTVTISVNGVELPHTVLLTKARTLRLSIPDTVARGGVNEITLHWGVLEPPYSRPENGGVRFAFRPHAAAVTATALSGDESARSLDFR